MTADPSAEQPWADRAAARSPVVQRSRDRSIAQAKQIVDAAIGLVDEKGSAFTIQELATHSRVALQTFYRHFAGKDELLLAVIEQTISDSMVEFEKGAKELAEPVSKLRFYVSAPILSLDDPTLDLRRRFITAEHYRLHQIFPDELSLANRAYTDLLIPTIRAAAELGQVTSTDIEGDAWYITELVMAMYHHYAYAASDQSTEQLAATLWSFCLRALGGNDTENPEPARPKERPPARPNASKATASRSKKARS